MSNQYRTLCSHHIKYLFRKIPFLAVHFVVCSLTAGEVQQVQKSQQILTSAASCFLVYSVSRLCTPKRERKHLWYGRGSHVISLAFRWNYAPDPPPPPPSPSPSPPLPPWQTIKFVFMAQVLYMSGEFGFETESPPPIWQIHLTLCQPYRPAMLPS